jgi:hypothetical protein
MAKMAQVLSDLNKTFFDCEPSVRFDLAGKKFYGSSLGQGNCFGTGPFCGA